MIRKFKKPIFRIILLAILLGVDFQGLLQADDCNLRGYDGTNIVKLDCETTTPPTSRLRVSVPDGTGGQVVRGVNLVDPTISGASNPAASKFRVSYTDASTGDLVVKAIGAIPPGISSCEELQMIGFHPDYPSHGIYELGTDIDCAATNPAHWATPQYANKLWQLGYAARFPKGFDGIAGVNPATGTNDDNISELSLANLGSKGFKPLKDLKGTFDGKEKTIRNIYISRSSQDHLGLFLKITETATVRSVKLQDCRVVGSSANYFGILTGQNSGTIEDSSSQGSINASQGEYIGGLAGSNSGIIKRSYSATDISGKSLIGGLSGVNTGTISECYSSESRRANSGIPLDGVLTGGLVGENSGIIINSYSKGPGSTSGESFGASRIGGLVGRNLAGGSVTNCYNSGSVKGTTEVGGLIGKNNGGAFYNSYSTGTVTSPGTYTVGGLIGMYVIGTFRNGAWLTGTTTNAVGFFLTIPIPLLQPVFLGSDEATINAFYSATHAVYQNSATAPAPSNAWDFTNVWKLDGGSLPRLRWED